MSVAYPRGRRYPDISIEDVVIDVDKDWAAKKIENLGEPVSPNDAARKAYVDIATTGLGINYYLLDAGAGVDTYKQLSVTPPELAETYVEVTRNAAGDVEIGSWIASADETPVLRLGVYATHFQAERTGGNIDVRFLFRLYERDTGDVETLINESSLSDLVVARRDVIVGMILASDYEMAAGSRLVLKVYVSFLSSGANTTVRLYYQGDVRSRLAIPIAKEILDGLYLPYTGARYDLDLNAKNLTNVGTVDGVDVSAHAANPSAHHAKTTSIGDLTDHDKAAHDALNINADTVDGDHKADLENTMDSKITTHKGDASAHHAKTGDDEVYGLIRVGTDAGKPAAGVAGRFYWATDTEILYRDTGAAWEETARGESVTRLAQLSEKAHSSLTGIGADDHHAQLHSAAHRAGGADDLIAGGIEADISLANLGERAHSSLTGIGASDHHVKTGDDEVYGLIRVDLDANKPAAGVAGRFFWATDTKILYRDTGTAWEETARGETAIRLAQLSERAHSSLTGIGADDHHAQDHSSRHAYGGADEIVGILIQDVAANRPAAGVAGRFFLATDTMELSRDNGSAWETIGVLGGQDVSDYSSHKADASAHHTKTTDASELTSGTLNAARLPSNQKIATITFIIDGGGSAITTGEKGHLEIPFACTIQQVTMLADQSGSIVVDIWKDTYANFPPTDADSITASAPPTISSAQKSQDSTLSGWTTSIASGDILAFNVDSCTTITRVTISLKVAKS